MLLSIHVPKAAGNSFREALMRRFGDRVMLDYGDWAGFNTPEVNERRRGREDAMRARKDELAQKYDVIHGHFIADKYDGLFPIQEYSAFFRDPYQQVLAHYHFLARNPQREHPEARMFHEQKMSVLEYIEWGAFRDHQSQFLGKLSIDDLAFVGLSSEYPRSLEMFAAIFGHDLGPEIFENVNNERTAEGYPVTDAVRAAVQKYRAADLELYARAQEIFARQSRRIAV
ncbi:MAG: hypothetical protein ABI278_02090 [Candidatus Aquilonibacter sp.]